MKLKALLTWAITSLKFMASFFVYKNNWNVRRCMIAINLPLNKIRRTKKHSANHFIFAVIHFHRVLLLYLRQLTYNVTKKRTKKNQDWPYKSICEVSMRLYLGNVSDRSSECLVSYLGFLCFDQLSFVQHSPNRTLSRGQFIIFFFSSFSVV